MVHSMAARQLNSNRNGIPSKPPRFDRALGWRPRANQMTPVMTSNLQNSISIDAHPHFSLGRLTK